MCHINNRPYQTLSLEVFQIATEHAFAAGSAIVNPVNANQVVMEEWEEDPTDTRIINW